MIKTILFVLQRDGLSKYNKIYEFDYFVFNENCKMIMTSVSGHLLGYEFDGLHRGWNSCNPVDLFSAPVIKQCPKDFENIKVNKFLIIILHVIIC